MTTDFVMIERETLKEIIDYLVCDTWDDGHCLGLEPTEVDNAE